MIAPTHNFLNHCLVLPNKNECVIDKEPKKTNYTLTYARFLDNREPSIQQIKSVNYEQRLVGSPSTSRQHVAHTLPAGQVMCWYIKLGFHCGTSVSTKVARHERTLFDTKNQIDISIVVNHFQVFFNCNSWIRSDQYFSIFRYHWYRKQVK